MIVIIVIIFIIITYIVSSSSSSRCALQGKTEVRNKAVYKMKVEYMSGALFRLCPGPRGCPWEFREYFRYIYSLTYDEVPDYK